MLIVKVNVSKSSNYTKRCTGSLALEESDDNYAVRFMLYNIVIVAFIVTIPLPVSPRIFIVRGSSTPAPKGGTT